MRIRTYSELVRFETFEDRFDYLKLNASIGIPTFGFDRYLNQIFYNSSQWKKLRRDVIIRDDGCDLGMKDLPIFGRIYVHHVNPITVEEVVNRDPRIFNPEFLISTSERTHKAIHYNSGNYKIPQIITRTKFDTCPWKERSRYDR